MNKLPSFPKTKRLVCISSPADLVNAIAFIRSSLHNSPNDENYIIGLEKNHFSAATLNFVQKICSTDRTLIDNVAEVIQEDKPIKRINRRKLGVVDELLVWRAFSETEVRLINRVTYKKLVLIENGIGSYSPPILKTLSTKKVSARAKRIDQFWGPLVGKVAPRYTMPNAIFTAPETEDYVSFLKSLSEETGVISPDGISSIVVGSSYYRLGVIKKSDEEELYYRAVNDALKEASGYVLWKPHHRAKDFRVSFGDPRVLTFSDAIPLELIIANIPAKPPKIIGLGSSILPISKFYFNSPIELISDQGVNKIVAHVQHVNMVRSLLTPNAHAFNESTHC